MIEDDFTPNTGIKVNLHVIPPANLGEGAGSVLLLAATAGEAPDVAVGVPSQLPVDFAVRKGLVNLNEFPDYQQVAQRFRPGALVPFRYAVPVTDKTGDWALPETQDFAMLFYRTDILHELGVQPPDTWEDVYDALLKLQQNGLDLYYPPPTGVAVTEGSVGFTPFLFQNGGDYYRLRGRHQRVLQVLARHARGPGRVPGVDRALLQLQDPPRGQLLHPHAHRRAADGHRQLLHLHPALHRRP